MLNMCSLKFEARHFSWKLNAMQTPTETAMTVSGAARRLEVSEQTVRRLESAGKLPAIRVGSMGMRLFDPRDVERYRRQQDRG